MMELMEGADLALLLWRGFVSVQLIRHMDVEQPKGRVADSDSYLMAALLSDVSRNYIPQKSRLCGPHSCR
jgi:hypothetical protein